MGLEYEVYETLESLEVALEDIREEIDDMTEPLIEAAELIQIETLANFAAEGGLSPDGEWEPLKPAYEKWKIRTFGGGPILQLRGDLIDAADDAEAIVVVSDTEVAYVVDDEKAPWHHSGRERLKGGRLPARPIIPDDRYYEEPIGEIVERWVEDVIDDATGEA